MKRTIIIASLLSMFSATSYAEDNFRGSAELSLMYKDKSQKEFQAKHRLDIEHKWDDWKHNYLLDVFFKSTQKVDLETGGKNYETSAQKWYLMAQTNYTMSKTSKQYTFGHMSYTDDRFGNYDYQSSYAVGYGKRWFEFGDSYFDAEIGLGFSMDKPKLDDVENKSIVRIASTFERKLLSDIDFKQTFGADLATQSDENTKIKQITSLTTKIMRSLALKLNFIVDYNTLVDVDKEKTNTETSLILVYNF